MSKKVKLTNNISFCIGVQKSINLINEILANKEYDHVYMLGELIHNYQVIKDLETKGVKILKDVNDVPTLPKNSILVIQSHGVAPSVYKMLNDRGINYVDSSCQLVKIIHRAIRDLENEGYYPLIIGDPEHTEVIGISGYVKNKPIVIKTLEDINPKDFKDKNKIGIVIQSTVFYDRAKEIIDKIKTLAVEVKLIDTICAPTKSRQREILEKSKQFKSVVVIGSRTSSNTNKLYDISKSQNPNTFFIESEKDIDSIDFRNLTPILITSGASAPEDLIKKVETKILKKLEF